MRSNWVAQSNAEVSAGWKEANVPPYFGFSVVGFVVVCDEPDVAVEEPGPQDTRRKMSEVRMPKVKSTRFLFNWFPSLCISAYFTPS